MALAVVEFRAQDGNGTFMTDVDVEVRRETGGMPLVQLYSDRDGNSAIGNPVNFPDGIIRFYVAEGSYQITVSKDGVGVDTFRHKAAGTLSEHDYQLAASEISYSDSNSPALYSSVQEAIDALFGGVEGTARLDWSVSGNALTVALKTPNGDDPSPSSPVDIQVRSASPANGAIEILRVDGPLSLTITQGSTLGFSNAVPGRLWAAIFDDDGIPELALINCQSSTSLFPLGRWPIASTVVPNSPADADLAHVFYSDTGVTSKPYAILGWASWESGLTTAGTWDANPTRVHTQRPSDPLPGDVVQSASHSTTSATTTTGTSFTNTNSAVSITPTSAANPVAINFAGTLWQQTVNILAHIQVRKGGSAVGTMKAAIVSSGGQLISPVSGSASDFPATTSSVTYTMGIKNNTAGSSGLLYPTGTGDGAEISATELMG